MRISFVNNISFGRLYLSNDKDTNEALKDLITKKSTLESVKSTLGVIRELSGNSKLKLCAHKELRPDISHAVSPYQYTFFLKTQNNSFVDITETCEDETHLPATLDRLKYHYLSTKYHEELATRTKDASLNKLFDNFGEEQKQKEACKSLHEFECGKRIYHPGIGIGYW